MALDFQQQPEVVPTSPIASVASRIPNEILIPIFQLTRSEFDGLYATLHPDHAPISLTRVCRQWRDVALGMPQLWANLRIPTSGNNPAVIHALKQWLAWSQNLPLTLELNLGKYYDLTIISEDIEIDYVNVLCHDDVASRWYSVQLGFVREQALDHIALRISHPSLELSLLQKFELSIAQEEAYHATENYWDDGRALLTKLSSCSNLKSLSLLGCRQSLTLPGFTCTAGLQELRLVYEQGLPTPVDMFALLNCLWHCAGTLRTLELNFPMVNLTYDLEQYRLPADFFDSAPVGLTSLKQLTILLDSEPFFEAFREWFQVPFLETLSIRDTSSLPPYDELRHVFIDILRMNSWTLTELDTNLSCLLEYPDVRTAIACDARMVKKLSLSNLDVLHPDTIALLKDLTLTLHIGDPLHEDSILTVNKNVVLQDLFIEASMPGNSNVDHDTLLKYAFIEALHGMIKSRMHIPSGAMTVDGEPVQRLRSLELGENLRRITSIPPSD